jgi:hypothetical protein
MKTIINSPDVICYSSPASGKSIRDYSSFKFFNGLLKCLGFILLLLTRKRKTSTNDFFSMKLNAIFSLCNLFFFQKKHQDSSSYSRGWTIRRFSMFSAFILLIGLNGLGQCGPFQIYESFGTQALPTQGGTWAHTSIGFTTSATARTGLFGLNFNAVGDLIRTPQIANPGVLSFWYKRSSNTGAWTLNVQTSPDNSTWTTRGTVSSATTSAQQYTIDIGTLGLTNVYIRLIDARTSGGTEVRHVDDLSITSTNAASNTILIQGQSCTPTLTAGTTYTIYDRGGVNDEYSSSQTTAPMVLTASSGTPVINITTLSTESSFDFVKLYNGNSTAATALHTGSGFSGSTAPGSFTAAGTSLTLDFTSDSGTNGGGFVATLTMPAISPSLTLANPTTSVALTSICASSTAVPIHAFNITGSNTGGTLTGFSFTTSGTYVSADVTNFKLLYNTSNTTVGATTLATLTTPGAAGSKSFTGFSQAIGNATGYFWITMDVASGVTNNGTITVSASATSGADMTTTVTKAGTAAASGTQTLKATPTSSAGAAQIVCSTATMAATSPTVGTGAWTLTSGTGTITTSSSNTSGLTALGVGANVFTWTVSNSTCTAATSTVTITGTATPVITSQPSNSPISQGGNTTFTVATSAGSPSYQWQYSANNSTWSSVANSTPAGVTYTNATTAILSVASTASAPASTYYYRCVVTSGSCSTNSNSATMVVSVPAPANDLCANATNLPCGTSSLSGTTVGAVSETAPTGSSSPFGVWYNFTGDGVSTTISSLSASGFDHELTIFSGATCGGAYTLVATIDNELSAAIETYTFTPVAGTNYFVYIAQWSTTSTATGTFTISRTCASPAIVVAVSNSSICSGSSSTISVSSTASYTYTWTPSTGLNVSTGSVVVASPLVTTTYTVTGTSGLTSATNSMTIVVIPAVSNVTASASTNSICAGNSISLSSTSTASNSLSLLSQSFATASLPAGVTTVVGAGDAVAVTNTSSAGGAPREVTITGSSQSVNVIDRLVTGPINTTGQTSLTLQWKNYLWHYSNAYAYGVSVQTSTDNVNWNTTSWQTTTVTSSMSPSTQIVTLKFIRYRIFNVVYFILRLQVKLLVFIIGI